MCLFKGLIKSRRRHSPVSLFNNLGFFLWGNCQQKPERRDVNIKVLKYCIDGDSGKFAILLILICGDEKRNLYINKKILSPFEKKKHVTHVITNVWNIMICVINIDDFLIQS